MSPLFSTLVQAFLFITVGFIGGALIALWWAGRAEKAAPPPPKSVGWKGFREVARLWRNEKSGRLAVEKDGKLQTQPEENVSEADVDLAREWMGWMGVYPEVPLPPVIVVPPSAISTSMAAPVPVPTPAPASTPPPQYPLFIAEPPVKPVPADLQTALSRPKTKPPEKMKTMVEQIEIVLQEIIARLPPGAPEVHLEEDMKTGVIVRMGLETFEGIENVPDPNVRLLLRKAVSDWEKRMEKQKKK